MVFDVSCKQGETRTIPGSIFGQSIQLPTEFDLCGNGTELRNIGFRNSGINERLPYH